MERNIEKDLTGIECAIKDHEERDNTFTVSVLQRCHELVSQLKEYKDLEEQGKLMKLPCAVGDTVYVRLASYCDLVLAEAEVRDFTHFISCGFCIVVTSDKFDKQNIPFSEFGKTVFLTREEAEAALKEL